MKAYFDTSALVPLLIDEPGTDAAGAAWDEAERVVTARLAYTEARAALAHAARLGRITSGHRDRAASALDDLLDQVEIVEVDEALARAAGALAQQHALRAYDAVHLAAALAVSNARLVLVAGDHALLAAATAEGFATAPTA